MPHTESHRKYRRYKTIPIQPLLVNVNNILFARVSSKRAIGNNLLPRHCVEIKRRDKSIDEQDGPANAEQ